MKYNSIKKIRALNELKYKKYAIKYNYDFKITILKDVLKDYDIVLSKEEVKELKKVFLKFANPEGNKSPFYKELSVEFLLESADHIGRYGFDIEIYDKVKEADDMIKFSKEPPKVGNEIDPDDILL